MAGGNANFPPLASPAASKKPENAGQIPPLARNLSRRHYTPKELAAALEAVGIRITARTVWRRCNLPADNALRIATNPAFPGRKYIPEAEYLRLCGAEAPAP